MKRLTTLSLKTLVVLCAVLVALLVIAPAGFAQGGAVIGADPPSHDFGDVVEQVQTVSQVFQVDNHGDADLVVTKMQIVGADAADFWLGFATWPFTLPPLEGQGFVVSFTPSSPGPKSAVLQIESNAQNGEILEVPLSGNGLELGVLGQVVARPVPNNSRPRPGQLITVAVELDLTGANAPADLLQSYEASLSWDPRVLSYHGFFLGEDPWRFPASINQNEVEQGSVNWFDVDFDGVGGKFTVIKFIFKVIGGVGSNTPLNLSFSRLEGTEVENLLPILAIDSGGINQQQGDTNPPDVAMEPALHNYGDVPLGSTASKTFVLTNEGNQDLVVSSTTLEGPHSGDFSIDSGGGSFTLTPGHSRQLVVSLSPSDEGMKLAVLLIDSNDPDEDPFYVPLMGSASAPDIAVSPASINFGDAVLGSSTSQIVVVTNEGDAPLHLAQFGLDGHENQFSYDSNNLAILEPGASGNVEVFFHPTTEGAKNATFVIHSNDPDESPVEIPLQGNGIPDPGP